MSHWNSPIHTQWHRGLRDILGKATADRFAALGVTTVGHLLTHVPRRYIAGSQVSDFSTLQVGDEAAVVAQVVAVEEKYGGMARLIVTLSDGQRTLNAVLFAHNRYLIEAWKKKIPVGSRGIFVGKVGIFANQLQFSHPNWVILDGSEIRTGRDRKESKAHSGTSTRRRNAKQRLADEDRAAMSRAVQRSSMIGLYPATAKLPTWVIAESISLVLPLVTSLGDTLPEWVVKEADVLPLPEALEAVHEPRDKDRAQQGIDRLRFEEAFGLQLALARRRRFLAHREATPRLGKTGGALDQLDATLPFALTPSQRTVGDQIFDELASSTPMNRLLQGDVGSGKTVVALRAMLRVVDAGGQAALLAPTEVLAKQHEASIRALLGKLARPDGIGAPDAAVDVTLLVGSMSADDKRNAQRKIANSLAQIVIGTHAMLQEAVEFGDLGLVVVDEQHRFGVEQRAALAKKAHVQPHSLIMTATPIPRSLAITIFGDLAVSELREKPANRAEVSTVVIDVKNQPSWVERAWQRVREEVARGRQAFVVCPAIGSQTDNGVERTEAGLSQSDDAGVEKSLTSVTKLIEHLESGPLAGLRLAMVHGKQSVAERDGVMAAFVAGKLDVLVSTTVIEVGVDVPNASMMVIMDADRFGISQLHQMRGRIGRGEHPGLCLLMSAEPQGLVQQRLQALVETTDGFVLAERDLELRREGDVLGASQSGVSSLKLLRALKDRALIENAKTIAGKVMDDPRAHDDPLLADVLLQAEQVSAGLWLERS